MCTHHIKAFKTKWQNFERNISAILQFHNNLCHLLRCSLTHSATTTTAVACKVTAIGLCYPGFIQLYRIKLQALFKDWTFTEVSSANYSLEYTIYPLSIFIFYLFYFLFYFLQCPHRGSLYLHGIMDTKCTWSLRKAKRSAETAQGRPPCIISRFENKVHFSNHSHLGVTLGEIVK